MTAPELPGNENVPAPAVESWFVSFRRRHQPSQQVFETVEAILSVLMILAVFFAVIEFFISYTYVPMVNP